MDFVYGVLPLLMLGAYLWLQIRALRRFRQHWWWAATVPAVAMAAALLVGILGAMMGANLAPLWFFLTLPVALLFLVILSGFQALRGRRYGTLFR